MFEIEGIPVLLQQKAVVSFSLAIHELATNAAKYGPLSVVQGKVSISRRLEDGDESRKARLHFRWAEHGGPAVTPPTKKGFGSRLVERLLAAELNGRSTNSYGPAGVVCEIDAVLDIDA
jgi:two-component sensor histidine kinase